MTAALTVLAPISTAAAPAGVAGMLVLVVGPSGAGKDTLIRLAREYLGDDPRFVFTRRTVTREASPAEDHAVLSDADFEVERRDGAFAFWWQAHGLKYGISAAIDADLFQGRTVICNVSRAIVPKLRARYPRCRVVLIDAPRDMRAARIAARGRAADSLADGRIDRATIALLPDTVIDNSRDPAIGGQALARVIAAGQTPRL